MTSPALWRPGEPVAALRAAVERGGLLAIPTESSYGLGVDPENERAVSDVYRVKGRGAEKALPVVAADEDQLRQLGVDLESPLIRRLTRLWPAPLTIIAPLSRPLPAAAGGWTLAVRVPASETLRALLRDLGRALTATSANRSGEAPVLTPSALGSLLDGEDAVIVDGGTLQGGAPSTLVEVEDDRLRVLRRGAYPEDALRAAVEEGER